MLKKNTVSNVPNSNFFNSHHLQDGDAGRLQVRGQFSSIHHRHTAVTTPGLLLEHRFRAASLTTDVRQPYT